MGNIFGVDISHWQGNFDFKKAKAEGVKFVILKCGGGDSGLYKDSKFDQYYASAKAEGLDIGAYFFGYANTTAGAKKEAEKCIEIIKGKEFTYPIFYDVEVEHMNVGSKTNTTALVTEFCSTLEAAGYWSGFYTNEDWYYYKLNGADLAKRFSFWLASWKATMPNIPNVQMWQFGGEYNPVRTNIVAGVICDQDYCFVDFPTKIREAERNNLKMSDVEKAKKWAIDNKLILGYGNGDYGWKDSMTREQFVVLLYRYYNKIKSGELK